MQSPRYSLFVHLVNLALHTAFSSNVQLYQLLTSAVVQKILLKSYSNKDHAITLDLDEYAPVSSEGYSATVVIK